MRKKMIEYLLCGALCIATPISAQEVDSENPAVKHSAVEIVTSALGLENLKEYSANQNAIGVNIANILGFEASYYDLGKSKFAQRKVTDGEDSENIGGRIDLKLAVDMMSSFNKHTRFYSRVGMYLWDVDVNYNRMTREFHTSEEGSSGLVSLGAAYGSPSMRVSVELERISSMAKVGERGRNQMLVNMVSRF